MIYRDMVEQLSIATDEIDRGAILTAKQSIKAVQRQLLVLARREESQRAIQYNHNTKLLLAPPNQQRGG